LLFLPAGHGLAGSLAGRLSQARSHPLLDARIWSGFRQTVTELAGVPGVRTVATGPAAEGDGYAATPALLATPAAVLAAQAPSLLRECFGPAALLVEYSSTEDLLAALDALPGSLTGTLHADVDGEPELVRAVSARLADRAGRVIIGGWPTGVAVTWAMQHGGPWPSTSHAGHTSVGVTAMRRFQRPLVFQDAPPAVLPPALQDRNPWGLPRRVNGRVTTDPL
jgi:NADP-dependent aldehyde dehydrogenase